MKKKLTILAFGLLLAVGWTNSVSAQLKLSAPVPPMTEQDVALTPDGQVYVPKKAPSRGHSDVYANEVSMTKDDYSRISYTWYEGTTTSATSHSASLTDTVTDPYQMYWLLRSTYINTAIPGILWNDIWQEPTTYWGLQRGWNIGSLQPITVTLSDSYAYICNIEVLDTLGNTLTQWTGSSYGTSLPTGWSKTGTFYQTSYSSGSYGRYYYMSGGGTITINPSVIANAQNAQTDYYRIRITARGGDEYTTSTIYYSNGTFDYSNNGIELTYGSAYTYTRGLGHNWGTIDPPAKNAYTIFLLKLKDFTEVSQDEGWAERTWQNSTSELINVFDKYYESIELLTDGLRVGEGTDAAGTVFAYRGVLNRFYFIGKGKTASYSSTGRSFQAFDWGPLYTMYEEFSPTTTDVGVETADFYQNMHAGEYYPVKHDCATVLGYQHYFSMYGKDTIVHKSVAPMVLYIPDLRSQDGSRNYEEGHRPQVGLYTIQLYAETEPSATYAQDSTYTVTLDWTSTLNDMVNNTVNQTYVIYTVTYDAENNPIYTPLDTLVNPTDLTYSYDVPQTQASQQIHYVIMGFPTDATNNPDVQDGGIFYTYSNVDDVQIPGWFDFMVLYRERYESDFVIHEEKNYYRNWLYPTNIAENTGMTMGQLKQEWPNQTASYTLWRDDTGVAVLEVKAIGKKVYYRIKYYDETQVTTGVNDIEMPIEYQTISNN